MAEYRKIKERPNRRTSFVSRIACIRDNALVISEKMILLCIQDKLALLFPEEHARFPFESRDRGY